MTADEVLAALDLPREARVDRRIAKKLLIENSAATAADKRQIQDGLEDLLWVAAVKPSNAGVPEYRDAAREVVEISVLSGTLRSEAKAARIMGLIHRTIPYPLLLVLEQEGRVTLSAAAKRFSQNEAGEVVLEGAVISCELEDRPASVAMLSHWSLSAQPRNHLWALYQGWMACIEGHQAATITGQYRQAKSEEVIEARRQALASHARLQRDLALLRAQAERERQMQKRVELNLGIRRLRSELDQVNEILKEPRTL
ncbi:MAG: DUF4391 domain-containing protein [Gemmataceae bacterium]|nr:DUF4391 domain-containing protein [Gemmataceae bacterium]